MNDVTRILNAIEYGNPKAAEQLLPLVYQELRRLAASKMGSESHHQTLQPTALVHEAWIRLVGEDAGKKFHNRGHFFAAAAEAMRRILIDNARRKRARRHGGGQQRVNIEDHDIASNADAEQLLEMNDALDKLAAHDAQKAELVKLRFFVGMTIEEAAEVLGISAPTAKRYWAYSRAFLYREMDR